MPRSAHLYRIIPFAGLRLGLGFRQRFFPLPERAAAGRFGRFAVWCVGLCQHCLIWTEIARQFKKLLTASPHDRDTSVFMTQLLPFRETLFWFLRGIFTVSKCEVSIHTAFMKKHRLFKDRLSLGVHLGRLRGKRHQMNMLIDVWILISNADSPSSRTQAVLRIYSLKWLKIYPWRHSFILFFI